MKETPSSFETSLSQRLRDDKRGEKKRKTRKDSKALAYRITSPPCVKKVLAHMEKKLFLSKVLLLLVFTYMLKETLKEQICVHICICIYMYPSFHQV